ncbi:MAG TPA: hypothetical protein VH951_06900, partial [Dehalococcoidia bacterium]
MSQRIQISRQQAEQGTGLGAGPTGPKRRFPMSAVVGVVLLSAVVGAGSGAGVATLLDNGGNSNTATVSQPATTSNPVNGTTKQTASVVPGSVADLYAKVRPSVVKIDAAATRSGSGGTGSGLILD